MCVAAHSRKFLPGRNRKMVANIMPADADRSEGRRHWCKHLSSIREKGLHVCNSPMGTLSQNGYGAKNAYVSCYSIVLLIQADGPPPRSPTPLVTTLFPLGHPHSDLSPGSIVSSSMLNRVFRSAAKLPGQAQLARITACFLLCARPSQRVRVPEMIGRKAVVV